MSGGVERDLVHLVECSRFRFPGDEGDHILRVYWDAGAERLRLRVPREALKDGTVFVDMEEGVTWRGFLEDWPQWGEQA